MISRIARLRAKKGFTIIELIVVIAIIAILTAMIVPAMTYNNKPAIGKGLAKEMYYRAQEVLSDCKAAGASLPGSYCTCYYAQIDDVGNVVEKGYFLTNAAGNIIASGTGNKVIISDTSTSKTDLKMSSMMDKYLTEEPTRNMAGHIVVACDTKFRAVAAYWFENFDWTGGVYFSDDYILASNGQYCASYPAEFCTAGGRNTFNFKDLIGSS